MKRLWVVGLLFCAGVAIGSEVTPDDLQRLAKISRLPISVYPDFSIRGTGLVPLLNEVARPDDALVVSHLDALKGDFRVRDLGSETAQIWIHLRGEAGIRDAHRRNFEHAKGVVFVPPPVGRGDFRFVRGVGARLRDDAHGAGMVFVMGLDEADHRLRANAGEMAAPADVVTIYLPKKMRAGPQEFRSTVQRIVADARAANPGVKVELALSTASTVESTRYIGGLAFANADLADRLAFYCQNTAESFDSLRLLFKVLRPDTAAGQPTTTQTN